MYEYARENKLISRDYYIKYVKQSRLMLYRYSAYTISGKYAKLISFSRNIHKHATSDEDRYYCQLIHYFILIMSNTKHAF